jgi:hypothetical protein
MPFVHLFSVSMFSMYVRLLDVTPLKKMAARRTTH